jgi:hypothetical protein
MMRFSLFLIALGAIVLTVGGLGFAARSADTSAPYGLVDATRGEQPTFDAQDNMTSVRRVGVGRYCLLAAVAFSDKTVGQVSVDLGLSGGNPGIAEIDTTSTSCQQDELAVDTFKVTNEGRLRLSNTISFIANPEG